MANDNDESQGGKALALQAIGIGLLFVSSRLLFEQVALSQPQCELSAHPVVHALVSKFFELLDKIGDAAIIAGLIGIIIDEGLKSKFIQEVVRAASPKLIGQHLPESIREALLSYFNIVFIRPEWEIEYEITKLDKFPEYLCITSRIQGIVQNCGRDTEEYMLISSLDPAPAKIGPGEALITHVSMTPESGTGGFEETHPDNSKLVQPDGTKLFKRSVLILPGGRFKTVLETIEYRPISSIMPLFTGTTVVKSIVRIRYPKELLDIQVSTGTSTNFKPEPTVWGAQWEIPIALLPGQSIVTTWNPKEEKPGVPKDEPPIPPPPTAIDPQTSKQVMIS